jgi:NAD-dependent dihydropyrimidine dehydrogenase PreA subunit
MFNSYTENTLLYDADLCINCGKCWEVCPHSVFAPGDKKAVLVNKLVCMECGACQMNCPPLAIKVNSGVGCAAAMIQAALTGRKEISCGPDTGCDCC